MRNSASFLYWYKLSLMRITMWLEEPFLRQTGLWISWKVICLFIWGLVYSNWLGMLLSNWIEGILFMSAKFPAYYFKKLSNLYNIAFWFSLKPSEYVLNVRTLVNFWAFWRWNFFFVILTNFISFETCTKQHFLLPQNKDFERSAYSGKYLYFSYLFLCHRKDNFVNCKKHS